MLVQIAIGVVIILFILLIGSLVIRYITQRTFIDPYVKSDKKLDGYYAIITGGNSGIGYETAKYLAKKGAYVVIACRNEERGVKAQNKLMAEIKKSGGKGKVEFMPCELSDLKSVKAFINDYLNKKKYPLHFLINNAGIAGNNFKLTVDKHELCWQVNYLASFYLTYQLLPLMVRSCKSMNITGRVVNLSSIWHKYSKLDVKTVDDPKAFHWRRQYGNSKVATIMQATYMQQAIADAYNLPIAFFSLHPGFVWTNIFKMNRRAYWVRAIYLPLSPFVSIAARTPKAGAQCVIHCTVADIGKKCVPGAFHRNNAPSITIDKYGHSTNKDEMKKLFDYSLKTLDLKEYNYNELADASY